MKKIVTILTVASLFAAVSASAERAQAGDVVVGGGVVPQSCAIDTVTNGTLKLSTPSKLVTDTPGKVKVTCNTTTSKLDIAINSGASNVYNGTPAIKFTGGTGVYAAAAGTSVSPAALVNGDSANVDATIDSGTAPLQAATNYSVFITPTLTP
jgi:type 1 fimbria pilin